MASTKKPFYPRQESAYVPIRDKAVLITGATGTLGRRLTDAFAAAGARLALVVRRMESVQLLQHDVSSRGISAFVLPCDLRFEEEVIRMIHRVIDHFGRIDVVVNAAAVAGPREAVEEYPVEPWRMVLSTNVTGTFLVCREILPWMKRQGDGCILNVTGGLSKGPRAACGAYLVSQHAIEGLTQVLAVELRGTGVRVNTIDVGISAMDARAEPAGREWLEAFLLLAGEMAVGSGQMVVASKFVKPAASV